MAKIGHEKVAYQKVIDLKKEKEMKREKYNFSF